MELSWTSPGGRRWPLNSKNHDGVFVELDTLVGGTGTWEDATLTIPGRPGQVVSHGDVQIKPFELEVTLVVADPDAWVEFRAGLSPFRDGVLTLSVSNGLAFQVGARVRPGLGLPSQRPRVGSRLQVTFVADAGVWSHQASGTGRVVVTNWGDAPIWPEVVFSAPGVMALPSGVQVALPAPTSMWRLPLGREHGGTVYDKAGNSVGRVPVLGECVPVGDAREYVVPEGATLMWSVQVVDPWAH